VVAGGVGDAGVLDAVAVRRWCRLAAEALGRTRAEIDALNVFPVPDGDTGTNLHLTVLAAAEAVGELPEDVGAAATWAELARGALLGARGNSGVILSQMLRGMGEVLGAGGPLREALRHASDLAHRSVAHPVEGTMLSVLRAAGEACPETGEPGAVAWAAARRAREALRETTDRLEVLARNGVVDAGAAGLCVVLDALAAVTSGEYPATYDVPRRAHEHGGAVAQHPPGTPAGSSVGFPVDSSAGRSGDPVADPPAAWPSGGGYEVMYLLDADEDRVPGLRAELDGLGDSLVVVGGDGVWNVHVHTDDAGLAVEAGIRAGRPHRIRVTYLPALRTLPTFQALEAPRDRHAGHHGRGVVTVTPGEGLTALFEQHGATVVRRHPGAVPSPAELAEAIASAGDEVVVLPDDEAVLAVAEAAARRARDNGARVAVVPATASVQALAALAVHDPLRRFDDDVIAMTHAAGATRSGRLQVAEEEAVTSAGICRPGDVLGLIDGDVAVIGEELTGVALLILDRMLSGGGELVTVITGADAPAGLAEAVLAHLHDDRPGVEAAVYDGGQGRYPLLIGVE
jgi:DAK2 domain fusion protein YloV